MIQIGWTRFSKYWKDQQDRINLIERTWKQCANWSIVWEIEMKHEFEGKLQLKQIKYRTRSNVLRWGRTGDVNFIMEEAY
jgi:hypothetical protein